MERQKVIFTGLIPQCPYCNKPTRRTSFAGSVTLAYYQPSYDEKGNNVNPDRNIHTDHYQCLECNKNYTTKGNHVDGFYYDF